MRVLQKIAATAFLLGFPLSLVSGCASGGSSGTAIIPSPPAQSASKIAGPATAQWLQFGYDAGHDGYNPLETTINAKTVSSLQVGWNDSSIVQPGGIVVDGGVAYVDDMGQSNAGLYALDAATGSQKWYAKVNLNGSWGGFTHAVAAVAGNVVVTPCSNGSSTSFLTGLCGVNATTGVVQWKRFCKKYNGSPCGGLAGGGSSPTLYNGLIYFQSTQGVNEQPDTQALNPRTGAIVWDAAGVYHCPDAGETSGNPLPAANGLVYAVLGCQGTSGATEICALSASSGAPAWCDTTATPYVENMIAGNGKLFVTEPSSNLTVLALDEKTGAQLWTASLPGSNGSPMATENGRLFIEDGGAGVYALSTTSGAQLWSYTANANLYQGGALSIAGGIVYADGGGGNNGNVALTALSQNNGSVIWTSGSVGNGGAQATPVVVNGIVYAGCYTLCSFTPSKP